MSLHVVGGQFDERRNTSRTFQPEPGAVDRALRACDELRRRDPALAAWIAEGHPSLTAEEHAARFGGAYERRKP